MSNNVIDIENKAKELLLKQYLISAFIEERLRIVNYIYEGWDKNKPVLKNSPFLHHVGQQLCRALIIDLFSLVGNYSKTGNGNSLIANHTVYKQVYLPECTKNIQIWLISKSAQIATITKLRHNETAHYNFKLRESISLSFDHLPLINELFELAKIIIIYYGESFLNSKLKTGFDYEPPLHVMSDLESIVDILQKNGY